MADQVINPTSHVYDPTGLLSENKIVNEQRNSVGSPNRAIYARFGSFFAASLVVRDANGNIVTKDKYLEAIPRPSLSAKVGQDIIGAVVITDPTLPGPFYMDYQCVGGPWGASNEHIIEMYAKLMGENRPVHWPDILGKLDEYKPAHHYQDIGDLFGAEYWVEVMERMANAYLMGDNASHDEIWRRIDEVRSEFYTELNNLNTNLRRYIDQQDAALGVRIDATNAAVARLRIDMQEGDNQLNAKIDQVTQQLQANINAVDNSLRTHVADKNNPHATTAVQTGAFTAEQGAAVNTRISNHLSDTNNPHQTTAVQVGAFTAQQGANLAASLNAHIQDKGNPHSTTAVQTDAFTSAQGAALRADLTNHVQDKNNPHATTFGQVGAYSVAQGAALLDSLNAHIANKNNPHETTTAQVGAFTQQQGAALATSINNHIQDKNNPHETTTTKIGAYTTAEGQALTQQLNNHLGDFNNPHRTNAGQVGAYTTAQIDAKFQAFESQLNGFVRAGSPTYPMSTPLYLGLAAGQSQYGLAFSLDGRRNTWIGFVTGADIAA